MFCVFGRQKNTKVCKKQEICYHITPSKLPEDCTLEAEFTDIDLSRLAMKSLVITVKLLDVLDNLVFPCGNCGCKDKSLELQDMTIEKVKKLDDNAKVLKYPLVTVKCDILCTGIMSKVPTAQ